MDHLPTQSQGRRQALGSQGYQNPDPPSASNGLLFAESAAAGQQAAATAAVLWLRMFRGRRCCDRQRLTTSGGAIRCTNGQQGTLTLTAISWSPRHPRYTLPKLPLPSSPPSRTSAKGVRPERRRVQGSGTEAKPGALTAVSVLKAWHTLHSPAAMTIRTWAAPKACSPSEEQLTCLNSSGERVLHSQAANVGGNDAASAA